MDTLPGADVQAFSVERCVFFALAWIFSGVATPFSGIARTLMREERPVEGGAPRFFSIARLFFGVATPFLVERWTLVRDERLFSAERWTLL
jgi:hypothetical protein